MKKLKKILFLTLIVAFFAALLFSMGFVNKTQQLMPYNALEINVNQDDELYFLDRTDITQLLTSRGDSIVGVSRNKINVNEIENALNSHENIENAEVFTTINGTLKIKVKQRKPLIRVFNTQGESYYIDEQGCLMPTSEKYTANVPIANGYIYESYIHYYTKPVNQFKSSEHVNMLSQLYVLAKYVNQNKFWSNQIQQVYVNNNREIELVPLAGNHKIIFGDTTDLQEKFNKLYTFYLQGLNATGAWHKYATINLKFKNQVVCTKRV